MNNEKEFELDLINNDVSFESGLDSSNITYNDNETLYWEIDEEENWMGSSKFVLYPETFWKYIQKESINVINAVLFRVRDNDYGMYEIMLYEALNDENFTKNLTDKFLINHCETLKEIEKDSSALFVLEDLIDIDKYPDFKLLYILKD